MKRLISIFILIILLCCSCTSQNNNQRESEDSGTIDYEEGAFVYDVENDEYMRDFSFMETCIPDKEAAADVATVIFRNINEGNSFYENHEIYMIHYDTDDKIWIVGFGIEDALGGGFYIALREENAEVVRMWCDE